MRTHTEKMESNKNIEQQNAEEKSSSAFLLFIVVFLIPLILTILGQLIWS